MLSYVWLRYNLKPNTKVFSFSNSMLLMGNNMRSDYWTKEYKSFFKKAINFNIIVFHKKLKNKNYEYVIISEKDIKEFNKERVYRKLKDMGGAKLFKLVYKIKGNAWIFKVL